MSQQRIGGFFIVDVLMVLNAVFAIHTGFIDLLAIPWVGFTMFTFPIMMVWLSSFPFKDNIVDL